MSLLPFDLDPLKGIEPYLYPGVTIFLFILFVDDLKIFFYKWGAYVNIKRRWIQTRHIDDQSVKELIDVSLLLASREIGALIVIRQNADLNPFIRGGVEVDCKIVGPVLYSLFLSDRDNVLHDGAALIENGRISRMSAYLPMTRLTTLDQRLGTRHRAGLGISEVSDAVVIIVSEERGSISIAYGGVLYEELSKSDFTQRLENFLKPTVSK